MMGNQQTGFGQAEMVVLRQCDGARRVPLYDGIIDEQQMPSLQNYTIDLAMTQEQLTSVRDLIDEKYAWRGYGVTHKAKTSADCSTFIASIEDELVGTLSLTIDSDDGLAADQTFAEELAVLRQTSGSQLCELTKFAFASEPSSMHVLASLFHTIFIFGTKRYNCTDLLIEVNPRHIRFYSTMLGFAKVGGLKGNASVGAPSQLMRLKVSDIGTYINQHAGTRASRVRSLYPYFLTAAQECIIQERLAAMGQFWPFQQSMPQLMMAQ